MGEGVPAIFTGLAMRHAAAAIDGSGDPPSGSRDISWPTNDNPPNNPRARRTSLSRVHRRVVEPVETEQDNEPRVWFQRTVLSDRVTVPEPGDDLRTWKRMNGNIALGFETMEVVHFGAERDRSKRSLSTDEVMYLNIRNRAAKGCFYEGRGDCS